MPQRGPDDLTILSRLSARPIDRRVALAVAAASALIFTLTVPFAQVQLPVIWAFIPTYPNLRSWRMVFAILRSAV